MHYEEKISEMYIILTDINARYFDLRVEPVKKTTGIATWTMWKLTGCYGNEKAEVTFPLDQMIMYLGGIRFGIAMEMLRTQEDK